MFLIEPDYALDESLAALLASAGIAVRDGVIVDPTEHYFTDEQMIAVPRYGAHPATRGLALSFYPGARPLEACPRPGVQGDATGRQQRRQLRHRRSSRGSNEGEVRPARIADHRCSPPRDDWTESAAAPFRMIVVWRCRFRLQFLLSLSGQFRRCAGRTVWLTREERAPAMKPPVEVLPMVSLTGEQMRGIFHRHGSADSGAHSIRRRRDVVVAAMSRLAWAAVALGATVSSRRWRYRRPRRSRA